MAENDFGVAIIGMAGRFPQADTVQAFWENLMASRECISFYSDEELLAMGISPEFIQHPDYVKAKGEVADMDKFDAAFVGSDGHGTAESIDFLDQVAFADSADGWVAAHLAQGFHIVGQ